MLSYAGLLPWEIKFVRYYGGSIRFGRRMDNQPGVVAEGAEGFGEKTQVAVPKKLARANLQIGV